ncbi:helix-turn-helix transcriptional regulator, partial [Isoptericola sp. QY 916]|nr:WYL domain-containing protein [Isoptericola sp. QY 916]
TFRAEAEAAAAAVVVDREGWSAAGRVRPPEVDALQRAVVERRRVRIDYTGATGRSSSRVLDPWGLVDKDGAWYLIAGTDRGPRTFRVDRVGALDVTDEPAVVPDGVDLQAEWDRVVGEVEARRSATWATVRVAPEHVDVLRAQFGRHTVVVDGGDGARATVRVAAPTPLDVARHLAGWGAQADVVGPPEVRAELARLGAELVVAHGGTTTGARS